MDYLEAGYLYLVLFFLITVFLNKRKLSHKKEALFVRVIISFSIITIVAPTALMFLTKEHLIRQGYSFSIDEDKSWLQDRVYIFKKATGINILNRSIWYIKKYFSFWKV